MELETVEQIAAFFADYVHKVFLPSSPLYAAIAAGIARDADVVRQLEAVVQVRVLPVAVMAATHDLILEGVDHPLADYFQTRTATPKPPADAYPVWRDFFDRHHDAIVWRVGHRLVQTNEIRRCVGLMPAFGQIAARTGQPLAMIEVGPSAGLMMLWDRLRYDYAGTVAGPDDAPLTIQTEVRGKLPPLPATWPVVKARVGLDLNPLDARNLSDARWLQALIWPEQAERRARLQAAIGLLQHYPPHLIQGDVVDTLPQVIEMMPDDAALVVYHSYALVQLPAAVRESVYDHMRRAAHDRDVYQVALEWYNKQERPQLWLHHYSRDAQSSTQLAICEQHGGWVEWVG